MLSSRKCFRMNCTHVGWHEILSDIDTLQNLAIGLTYLVGHYIVFRFCIPMRLFRMRRALQRACYVVRFMLADRADIRYHMYNNKGRVAIIGRRETVPMVGISYSKWFIRLRSVYKVFQYAHNARNIGSGDEDISHIHQQSGWRHLSDPSQRRSRRKYALRKRW